MRDLQWRPLLIFFLSTLFSISIAVDTITPTTPLTDGKTLVSAGGSFALGFFTPSGSTSRYIGIWYNKVSTQTVVWVANRQSPTTGSTGTLTLSANGSLAITGSTWSTPATTTNITNPVAQLLDSGNLVVTDPNGAAAYTWQSFDYPTDTLLPGLKLGWDRKFGLNRNLTSWTSASDPSPGPYNLVMALGGDPEAYLWSARQKSWRTGPWSGLEPSGVPELQTYGLFSYEFVDNSTHVYYTYHILNSSIISRLLVNASGQMQRMVWLESSKTWSLYWFAPKDQCDVLATCGPYGVCDANRSPICGCLQGFRPKSPEKWALRDGTDGCVRKTALDCRNGTDGFEKVARAKVPESTMATVDRSMSLDQCRTACLSNCSCKAYASANVSGGGSGCVMWTTEIIDLRVYTFGGQDLFVRLAAADLLSTPSSSHKKSKVADVVVACCVLGALLIGCAGFCWRRKKTKRIRGGNVYIDHNNDESAHERTSMDSELPQFSLVTVFTATNNFSNENKLGEGGFGPVYKGIMEDGQDIAVKRLAKTSLQGLDEFKNEVLLIAKLQHRNLVRLLGCCIDKNERMLVYEYMCNKSLDAFLFDKEKRGMLDWKTRYNIILGIARGLLYLHQDSRLRIVHRDLKASNILLDKDMNPKISDFGMARIFGGDETEVNTRKVVGTFGYMSPEYAMDGVFSVKSDVYSFGVLVLEIISGRRNRGVYLSEDHQNLLGHAWSLWKEGNGHELLDDSVARSYSMAEALRCIKVGLLCVQERPEDRPLMSSVVLMLGSDSVFLSPPKQPGFVTTRTHTESDSSTSKQNLLETNEISTSLLEGR